MTHIIALALAAPVTEEIVFRGFLYRGFSESRIGVAGTIALTVAWALIHIVQGTAVLIDTATLPSWTRQSDVGRLPVRIHSVAVAIRP